MGLTQALKLAISLSNHYFMKYYFLAIIFITLVASCSEYSDAIKPRDSQISFRETHIRGRLHRAIEVTNKGRVCDCEACFGLCQFVITDEEPETGTTELRIINNTVATYIYLIDSISHAEPEFVVDNNIGVYVEEGTSLVARTLVAGTYNFEAAGTYSNPSGVSVSYGRVQVVTQ